ncbi:MAG: hypothetical protein ACRCYQ_09910 [Nocardioides sp.]
MSRLDGSGSGGVMNPGFESRHVIPVVLDAEPSAPEWVESVRRAVAEDGTVGVDWARRPSPRFADQVVQSLVVRPGGRIELRPPMVFPGEVPEMVHADDWRAYAVLAANIAGLLKVAQDATRTLARVAGRSP